MANAAIKVRQAFIDANEPLTLAQIRIKTELRSSEVSMALCYLKKLRHLTRELVSGTGAGRKAIWQYTYHADKLPKAE